MKTLMSSSVVEIVDELVDKAISVGASDIHLESTKDGLRIRFRIDGILHDKDTVSKDIADQVISRIKVLAGIDISQRRIPQDGKFKLESFLSPVILSELLGESKDSSQTPVILSEPLGESKDSTQIDFRVSTFPSLYGEKVVIRILDRGKQNIDLNSLGFSLETYKKFIKMISRPSGFILVTGPTGAGKTTTLYAALSKLHTPDKNIITLEDPVEYAIDNITQGHIQTDAGFTFAQGIRALLRQDPDIAMIGEIRDRESARIAIEASLTGHLVFSTLHTNNAASAIVRLMDMGIEPYLIKASLTGVLAQRLARKVCLQCCGTGCKICDYLGYKGRTGIFELLEMTDRLAALISESPDSNQIQVQAIADGMMTLAADAQLKLQAGVISWKEINRII